VDRQRIHVGSNADGAARARALEQRHDAGSADAGLERNLKPAEECADSFRRLVLLERQLGVLVQGFAQGYELRRKARGD
jgi:hypothetical protein